MAAMACVRAAAAVGLNGPAATDSVVGVEPAAAAAAASALMAIGAEMGGVPGATTAATTPFWYGDTLLS